MESKRKNCIAVNESETSKSAFEWYLKNHHRENDAIVLLNVYEAPHLPTSNIASEMKSYRDEKKKQIANSVKVLELYENICKERKIKYSVAIEGTYGATGQTICDWASENKPNVIVLAQRGLSGIRRVLLGSTSDYVLHNATVPIIVIPPNK
ncbi:uncharacterized protein LOC136088308 [Hydra vulgaris]|uniref:uncharacterized protein LOC136088308 n=1 Tax=Hydra vulgaris TaxID=6087 RepID=UPI0001926AFA